MARTAMNKTRKIREEGIGEEADKQRYEADKVFLANHNLDRLDNIITHKKIIWLAHIQRGQDQMLFEEFEHSKKEKDSWYIKLVKELEKIALTVEDAIKLATEPDELRNRINSGKSADSLDTG